MIREELFKLQDVKYGEFQKKLIPTVDPEKIIGIRTPDLRKLAKQLYKESKATHTAKADNATIKELGEANDMKSDIDAFLNDLPHEYFDENQLHAFLISEEKDFDKCIDEVEAFLPYVDNWATCDQMSPKVFKKNKDRLLLHVREWLKSDRTYTVRFAIGMLMEHYLNEDFSSEYPEMVAKIRSDEYYVNMMIAWYFATALAKQYETAITYIEEQKLDVWTHNKAIQKARESYRITPEQKEYLKTLKIK